MVSRCSGALSVLGGLAWILKFALIWMNGGTETTQGVVGILFVAGAISLALADGVRAWYLPDTAKVWPRILAALAFLAALVLMVNLPILIGWKLWGRLWIAEEVGVILTALIAVGLGIKWLIRGYPYNNSARLGGPGAAVTSASER
jgi:hypothetical protein